MKWYLQVLSKYAVFEGRARRKEYWSFFLWNVLIVFVLALVEAATSTAPARDQGALVTVYQLAMLIPSFAVAVRRMHDTNHSGWWSLVPIVSFVYALTAGDRGTNRFGPDPKGSQLLGVDVVVSADAPLAAVETQRP